ncbi:MAG: hypothetical protein JSW07_23015 [bacterium]|nr:MAG: hypothetical protein JSW07_23015 [bacterium]
MIIGAASKFGTGHRGEVYVVYGSSRFRPTKEIDFSLTSADVTLLGEGQYFAIGDALATGNINGDAIHNLL